MVRLARKLTPGETRMVALLFGAAVDPGVVHWFMHEMAYSWQSEHRAT